MPDDGYMTDIQTERYNNTVSKISEISDVDYSDHKVDLIERQKDQSYNDQHYPSNGYPVSAVRFQIMGLLSRLEEEYSFAMNLESPQVVIMNKNQNEVTVQVNYTISQLINSAEGEEKEKLQTLKEELEKPNHQWDKIKPILIWVANFSQELFFKVLPILLEKFNK